jgi:hypothetical protein
VPFIRFKIAYLIETSHSICHPRLLLSVQHKVIRIHAIYNDSAFGKTEAKLIDTAQEDIFSPSLFGCRYTAYMHTTRMCLTCVVVSMNILNTEGTYRII